jgi:hypothetical protein
LFLTFPCDQHLLHNLLEPYGKYHLEIIALDRIKHFIKIILKKEIDTDNLRELQLQDDIINIVLRWKEGDMRPAWSDISHTSPELKFYWSRLDSLIIVNGILYRKWSQHYVGFRYR